MASCKAAGWLGSRFLRVREDENNQIVDNAMSKSIKNKQTGALASLKESKRSKNWFFTIFFSY